MHPPATWPCGAEAALTLSFDDGLADTFRETVSWLAESGLAATYNLVTDRVGAAFEGLPTASWDDWACAQDQGHEIASHSATHVPLAGPASQLGQLVRAWLAAPDPVAYLRQLVGLARHLARYPADGRSSAASVDPLAEAVRSRAAIASRLPRDPVDSFIYPAGRHDRASRRAVALAGYRSARGLQPGVNHVAADRFALHALVVTPSFAPDTLEPWLRRALAQGGWLILAFHLVSDHNPTGYPYYYSTASFHALVRRLQAAPLWVAPQRAVVAWWEAGRA